MDTHDALQQVSYIQQTLSQNKKQLGFFLGAGCPLAIRLNPRMENGKEVSDPLIPDVSGLTKILNGKLSSGKKKESTEWDKVISLIKEDGGDESNIEHILTQIRLLASVAGKGTVRDLSSAELVALDEKICTIITHEVDKSLPDQKTPYHNLAVWARSIQREHPVHIFTTNYDLLIEQALEEAETAYFDGFIGARNAFFDLGAVEDEELLPSRWLRLWKIHGSLNWRLDREKNVIRSDKITEGQRHLIYPSHLKYDQSRKMPYLAMLDRLKEFLLKPSATLFISGYSFGDEHINDVICRTLATNPTAHVFAFLFGNLDVAPYEEAKHCASRTPNLSLMAFDKAIIGRSVGEWKLSEAPFSLPAEVVLTDTENDSCMLQLGDFSVLGKLVRNVSLGRETDNE